MNVPSITPGILYHDAPEAIEWLCRVFGFEIRTVIRGEGDQAHLVYHAHLSLGLGGIMLSSAEQNEHPALCQSPKTLGGPGTVELIVYVPEIEAHYAKALAEGAAIIQPLEEKPYGGKSYVCRDPEGHIWVFGSYNAWA